MPLPADRRRFLKTSAAATAALSVAGTAHAAASDRVNAALIGPGGMGSNHLRLLVARKDLDVTYVCDPDESRLAAAAKLVEQSTGKAPKAVKDMRQVYDDKAIDAVWIATPDHWHAPATLLALAAGKHVYVEKPCSHNVREGRLMVEAARKANKVVQVGTQTRSTEHARKAVERLRAGAIGEVLVAKAWNSQLRRSIGKVKPSAPPAHLDYELWLGPVPFVPFQANFLPGIWRWWYAFGCGDIGNDGVHDIDIARWGLGVAGHPTAVAALGGKSFFDDDQQWPDTQYVVFEYAGAAQSGAPKQLVFEQRIWSPYVQEGFENGNAFYGTKGMMVFGKGGGWKLYGERNKLLEESAGGSPNLPAHHQDFLDCVRSGKRPSADIEEGHLSASLCHLANIATRLRRTLTFDPRAERFRDAPDADALLARQYRDHWAAPKT